MRQPLSSRVTGRLPIRLSALAPALLLAVLATAAHAAPAAPLLNAQGTLTASGGGPAADGVYVLTFRLYADVQAPAALWKETQLAVTVKGGAFATVLGAGDAPIPADLFAKHPAASLSVQVQADPELPRVQLLAVPYALHAATAEALAGGLTGDKLAPGSLPASALGFPYAGSDTKGGPALDLKCTGCVELGDLAAGVLDAKNVAITIGAKASNVQAELGVVHQHVRFVGDHVGIGKNPSDLCALDVGSDGGGTCIDGALALWTRIAQNEAEMQKYAQEGTLVFRKDTGRNWVYAKGLWRRLAYDALCGDGVQEGLEECDDGAANADVADKCRTTCKKPGCGDKIVDSGEGCDDGNTVATDACVACQVAKCGDGAVQAGVEECDDGAANANVADKCRTSCVKPKCGDKIVDKGEACDDGNDKAGDGCSPACTVEVPPGYPMKPNCSGCANMVIVKATKQHAIGGNSYTATWTNLNAICADYAYRGPTTSSSSADELWNHAKNLNFPITSNAWNPTGPWMTGALPNGFPGGRIWMASGAPSWLSRAIYPVVSNGNSLYTNQGAIQWESYHPQSGGNGQSITSGTVQIGDYVLCAE